MRKCFYMNTKGIDFIMNAKDKKYVTNDIAIKFINAIQTYFNRFYNISINDVECVKNKIQKASYEIRIIENGQHAGKQYVNIFTDNGCFGCDPTDNISDFTCIFE